MFRIVMIFFLALAVMTPSLACQFNKRTSPSAVYIADTPQSQNEKPAQSGSTVNQAHDGKWWLSLGKEERIAYVAGYIDYYVYVRKGPLSFSDALDTYVEYMAKKLNNSGADRGKPIFEVLETIAAKSVARPNKGGEEISGGIFDGDYWRQLERSERIAFIQGLLDCQRKDEKAVTRFSRGDDSYVAQISQWYGVKEDDPSEINEKRESKKIHEVMNQFKDK